MRTITNIAGLPTPMYNALSADTYVGGGDISITRVIAPPRIVALRKQHESDIKEDAADRIWSLLGSSVHRILELSASDPINRATVNLADTLSYIDPESDAGSLIDQALALLSKRKVANKDGVIVETRLKMPVQGVNTDSGPLIWTVSGQPDVYQPNDLYDYKVTSVWAVLFGNKPEWEAQLNLQAHLHRHNGDKVDRLFIIAILRDWQKRKANFEKDYPQVAVEKIAFPMWTPDQAQSYLEERVKLHQKTQLDYAKSGFDANTLPMCSEEERWLRGAGFAVKFQDKSGKVNKNAKRVFSKRQEAENFMRTNVEVVPKGKTWAPLEERRGENIRCLDYCDVWQFCPFGKLLREGQLKSLPDQLNLEEGTEE